MTRQNHTKQWTIGIAIACGLFSACTPPASYDLVLRGGDIYDGSGGDPFVGDVAIDGDTIIALGDIGDATATIEIDVKGLAVAPGFVNMMSWANESLIEDGRSQSDIRQGVTLEIMGEGNSMGPLNDAMKAEMAERQSDIRYDIEWTSLAEYLEFLERRGISPNVASFIGTATPRKYVIGDDDRPPTPTELDEMRAIVRVAMQEGALGVASSLMYPFLRTRMNSSRFPRLRLNTTASISRTCAMRVLT
jgi:N-acyl-D-amino-acid deacylase